MNRGRGRWETLSGKAHTSHTNHRALGCILTQHKSKSKPRNGQKTKCRKWEPRIRKCLHAGHRERAQEEIKSLSCVLREHQDSSPKSSFMAINRLMYKNHPQVNCSASVSYNFLVSPTSSLSRTLLLNQSPSIPVLTDLCAENLGDCSHRQQVEFFTWNAEACKMLA